MFALTHIADDIFATDLRVIACELYRNACIFPWRSLGYAPLRFRQTYKSSQMTQRKSNRLFELIKTQGNVRIYHLTYWSSLCRLGVPRRLCIYVVYIYIYICIYGIVGAPSTLALVVCKLRWETESRKISDEDDLFLTINVKYNHLMFALILITLHFKTLLDF